jgi:hypothetical protein
MVAGGSTATPAKKRAAFIRALKRSANVSRAAVAAKIATSTAYRWRAKNEAFRVAWDDAIDAALDDLETALLERAVNGVEKPIMYGGKQITTVRTYSDGLAMFLLRARRPQIYARDTVGPREVATDDTLELLDIERKLDLIAARPAAIE